MKPLWRHPLLVCLIVWSVLNTAFTLAGLLVAWPNINNLYSSVAYLLSGGATISGANLVDPTLTAPILTAPYANYNLLVKASTENSQNPSFEPSVDLGGHLGGWYNSWKTASIRSVYAQTYYHWAPSSAQHSMTKAHVDAKALIEKLTSLEFTDDDGAIFPDTRSLQLYFPDTLHNSTTASGRTSINKFHLYDVALVVLQDLALRVQQLEGKENVL